MPKNTKEAILMPPFAFFMKGFFISAGIARHPRPSGFQSGFFESAHLPHCPAIPLVNQITDIIDSRTIPKKFSDQYNSFKSSGARAAI